MAKKNRATFAKREKERARQEKQALKRERRQGRSESGPAEPTPWGWSGGAAIEEPPGGAAEELGERVVVEGQ